jgi:cytochrome c biogenesis protein CcmG/thiol:disulfide interchange protein DsbE
MNLLSKRTIILLSLLALLPLVVFAGCSATDSSGNSSDNGTGDSSGPPVAPDFTMTTLDGNEVSFSDYKGKPILLNFAASWCGPCESEAPILAKAYERYKDQVVFLGVAVKDNVDSQRAFAQKHGLTFPIGGDPNGDIVYSYQKAGKVSLSGIPTTFFINKDGQIESFWVGPL